MAGYLDANGQERQMYVLPKDLTTTRADTIWFASENLAYYAESLDGVSDPIEAQRIASDQQAILENSNPVLKEGPVPVWSG